MKNVAYIFVAFCVFFSMPSWAKLKDCEERPFNLKECTRLLKQAEDRMNHFAYMYELLEAKAMRGSPKPPEKIQAFDDKFHKANALWIAYRDAECDFQSLQDWRGPENRLVAMALCQLKMTEKRVKYFKHKFTWGI